LTRQITAFPQLLTVAVFTLVMLVVFGCTSETEELYKGKFELELSPEWQVEDEAKEEINDQRIVTLGLENRENQRGAAVVTYLPAEYFSEEETEEEAEGLMETFLYRGQEDVEIEKSLLETEHEELPLLEARAGEREPQLAHTAVITGEKGHLLVTLLMQEDAREEFLPYMEDLVEGISVP